MSFAATLALVAGYQHGLPWMSGGGKTRLAAKIALWGGREIAGLLLVSLLAGAATIPYIAYHFHRISPYGVIANPARLNAGGQRGTISCVANPRYLYRFESQSVPIRSAPSDALRCPLWAPRATQRL